jgi:hypothetical protein
MAGQRVRVDPLVSLRIGSGRTNGARHEHSSCASERVSGEGEQEGCSENCSDHLPLPSVADC